ncbi:hypothetical protein DFP72DRAFT_869474 [Ephemerocybe angulata]|uniref:Uncharacterized protein n=1 Tax=Ephemerocybe angulata TaxID=980116 RepID=A0A8H6II55_9AGAR|nr:hypothetical protein DFP72DRAFT_869474 [Tulosesus angulatus]
MDTPQPQNATRIRNSITIKHSARRRHSPQPSPSTSALPPAPPSRQTHSISPCSPADIPEFPPPDVILHKDDAGSKVFLAIARSLLSVCSSSSSSSAATQAITTYLRQHNDRCEADHDQPLLLSHSLSGTDADDDLIPALYSLQGGNPRKVSPLRRTNFRKNTAVWYLSRATGAPCPFARAGIRLCDYTYHSAEDVDERSSKRRRSKHRDESVPLGQKRKRPLRSCVAKDSSDDDSSSENDPDNRPQKKLTLRIRLNCPSLSANRRVEEQPQNMSEEEESDSSDEEMEMEIGAEEEARESSPEKEEEEEPWRLPPYPRRSISIPLYTPSYDDDDDYHISMTRTHVFSGDPTSDSERESEDAETQFESPGPRSPSAPLIPPPPLVKVKEEPRDLQGMLDAWDDIDSSFADTRLTPDPSQVKVLKPEAIDVWDWDSREQWAESPTASDSSPLHHDKVLLDEEWKHEQNYGTIRPRFKTEPALASSLTSHPAGPSSLSAPPPTSRTTRDDSISGTNTESAYPEPYPTSSTNLAQSPASLILSMNAVCSGVSPSSLVLPPINLSTPDVVIVNTCQPCNPPVTATQIEDISVYQMVLGNFHFLRRIDTDFVNLSPIVHYLETPFPFPSIELNATVIDKGSTAAVGVWVPLSVAQVYLRDHPAKANEFDIFLSDELPFGSTLQTQQEPNVLPLVSAAEGQHEELEVPLSATEREIFDLCVVPDWDGDSAPSTATLPAASSTGGDGDVSDTSSLSSLESISPSPPPSAGKLTLSKEAPAPPQASTSSSSRRIGEGALDAGDAKRSHSNLPLRRSKRVADLTASHHIPGSPSAANNARARTRGGRGSRNSLS